MFCKHMERFDRLTRLTFGTGARLAGTAGSGAGKGELRIVLDGRTIGRGATFNQAFGDALRGAKLAAADAAVGSSRPGPH